MKKLAWILLILIAAGLPSERSLARELIVGVGESDYVPFYFEQEGTFKGAAAEIAQHLSKQLGHNLVFQRFPWKRVQHNLRTGRIDMVILYFKTEDRARDVLYLDMPHVYETSSLAVPSQNNLKFTGDINSLSGMRFGNVTGYWHGESYSKNENLTKLEFSSTKSLIGALLRGKIDIAVGNKPVITALTEEMGVGGRLRFLEPKIDYAPDYIAFSKAIKDAPELVVQYSDALRDFIKTAMYRQILNQYGFQIPDS